MYLNIVYNALFLFRSRFHSFQIEKKKKETQHEYAYAVRDQFVLSCQCSPSLSLDRNIQFESDRCNSNDIFFLFSSTSLYSRASAGRKSVNTEDKMNVYSDSLIIQFDVMSLCAFIDHIFSGRLCWFFIYCIH